MYSKKYSNKLNTQKNLKNCIVLPEARLVIYLLVEQYNFSVAMTTLPLLALNQDICTVGPRYNAPRYNADSGITRSTVAPENKPARGRFFFFS